MTTDTHKKPASGDGEREAFEKWYSVEYALPGNPPLDMTYDIRSDGSYGVPQRNTAWIAWQAALRYRDELDANRKCDCTFLCKFCRERRDELEKGHE
jgi:hypothetical protein